MISPMLPARITLGRVLFWCFCLILSLSMLSADFRDPSFFNQIYPADGLRNWISLPGALFGGSLVELLGPVALLLPWQLVRIFPRSSSKHSKISLVYFSIFLLLVLSALHALSNANFAFNPQAQKFFWKQGYLGQLAAIWMESTIGALPGLLLCLFIGSYFFFQLGKVLSPWELINALFQLMVSMIIFLKRKIKRNTGSGSHLHSIRRQKPLIYQHRSHSLTATGTLSDQNEG